MFSDRVWKVTPYIKLTFNTIIYFNNYIMHSYQLTVYHKYKLAAYIDCVKITILPIRNLSIAPHINSLELTYIKIKK